MKKWFNNRHKLTFFLEEFNTHILIRTQGDFYSPLFSFQRAMVVPNKLKPSHTCMEQWKNFRCSRFSMKSKKNHVQNHSKAGFEKT